MIGQFPFGEEVQKVEQKDRTPKKVFVLGVYASAVHAKWIDPYGKWIVRALAVASEPYIFWRGENISQILEKIKIPVELGSLKPVAPRFNGPSGKALDKFILAPLHISREETWLCDLVPHSCANTSQLNAIERAYLPLVEKYHIPRPSVPQIPRKLTDGKRRNEILQEIEESGARTLILLGDKPIQQFLSYFDPRWKRLSDFQPYGKKQTIKIGDRTYEVIALAHPRQIAKLGRSSQKWYNLHQRWMENLIH